MEKSIDIQMPFTGEHPQKLADTLRGIVECSLPIEVFDAFLSEYSKTKDLDKSRFFAMCEWDC